LTLVVATPAAEAATGTSVTPAVVTGSGLGFDAADAQRPSFERGWTASPYRAVNMYFSGRYRYHTSQPELTADWVTTVLSNGWSLIPTVVDLQAPCATSSAKDKIPANATNSQAYKLGAQVAATAHNDLTTLGLAGTVAYLDLEPFDVTTSSTCASIVRSYIHGWVAKLHSSGDKAGVYFHYRLGGPTIAAMYETTNAPDDVWVAQYDGVASAGTSVIGSKWPHHRIHQYVGNVTETYAGQQLNIDRDAIDGDVVAASSLTTPAGPPYAYNVNGFYDTTKQAGDTLNVRTQPNSSSTIITTLTAGASINIQCQATGETVYGDYVWDKLVDGTYVSDLYTTTTGRNSFGASIPRCDTTSPTVSLSALPSVTLASAVTIRWSAADAPDPDGNPNGESRGISSSQLRYRIANYTGGFGGWHYRNTTAFSNTLSLGPGHSYCLQVRSFDLSGNSSFWSTQSCVAKPLDDRSMSRSSGWVLASKSHFYYGTVTSTTRSGRVLARTNASLDRVGVIATVCAKCGTVRVYVGSHYVGTVNLYSPSTVYRRYLALPAFSQRSATVKIVTTSSKLVQVDGVLITRI
jgi:hypothetical protein